MIENEAQGVRKVHRVQYRSVIKKDIDQCPWRLIEFQWCLFLPFSCFHLHPIESEILDIINKKAYYRGFSPVIFGIFSLYMIALPLFYVYIFNGTWVSKQKMNLHCVQTFHKEYRFHHKENFQGDLLRFASIL